MATASSNFSHKIEDRKRSSHTLVTTGIYAVLRHPAYFGFFWYSVGTQAPQRATSRPLFLTPRPAWLTRGATWRSSFWRTRCASSRTRSLRSSSSETAYRTRRAATLPMPTCPRVTACVLHVTARVHVSQHERARACPSPPLLIGIKSVSMRASAARRRRCSATSSATRTARTRAARTSAYRCCTTR